jgi:beta-lactamase class D
MIREKLPISSDAFQMTKNLLFKEEIPGGWKLFGKTGLGSTVDENGKSLKVRWFVGWVESDQNFFPFAYLLQEHEIDIFQTVPRVKVLLEESNLGEEVSSLKTELPEGFQQLVIPKQ